MSSLPCGCSSGLGAGLGGRRWKEETGLRRAGLEDQARPALCPPRSVTSPLPVLYRALAGGESASESQPCLLVFSPQAVSFLWAPSLKQEACGPSPPAQGSQEVAHGACGTPLGSENPRPLPLPAESPRRGWGRGTGQHVEGAEPRAVHSARGVLCVGGPSSGKLADSAGPPWRNCTASANRSGPKPLLLNQRIQI